MNHLSQSRSSIIFEREGDSLSILYWGKKIGKLGSDFEKSIESALARASAHGALDAAIGVCHVVDAASRCVWRLSLA